MFCKLSLLDENLCKAIAKLSEVGPDLNRNLEVFRGAILKFSNKQIDKFYNEISEQYMIILDKAEPYFENPRMGDAFHVILETYEAVKCLHEENYPECQRHINLVLNSRLGRVSK